MTKAWYARFGLMVVACIAAGLAIAPNLVDAGKWPGWLQSAFPGRISPGLDIQGGLRLTYEVEIDEALRDRRDALADDIRLSLYRSINKIEESEDVEVATLIAFAEVDALGDTRFSFVFSDAADADSVNRDFLKDAFPDVKQIARSGARVELGIRETRIEAIEEFAVEQTARTISNRIDELQIRETSVVHRERDIIVEVPGASEGAFERIRSIISKTAKLSFQVVADGAVAEAQRLSDSAPATFKRQSEPGKEGASVPFLVATGDAGRGELKAWANSAKVSPGYELAVGRLDQSSEEGEELWRTWLLESRIDVSGEDVEDAFVSYDPEEGNKPFVAINFTPTGGRRFKELTGSHVNERMAIVLDNRVESAPVIQQEIGGGRARITMGSFGDFAGIRDEARDLALVLRAGALPAPIRPSNEQMIGPSLGRDAVQAGLRGALIGAALVFLFMLVYYQLAGFVADLMVTLNVGFLLAILSAFDATLTLPGVAGIALTVGMAVDANVLITERIREELRQGKSPRAALRQGFGRAFWSVVDSQLTTFIAGVVLFQYGTGPIKGFAVTLMIGIVTSLFTGIFCSRVMLEGLTHGLKLKKLPVG